MTQTSTRSTLGQVPWMPQPGTPNACHPPQPGGTVAMMSYPPAVAIAGSTRVALSPVPQIAAPDDEDWALLDMQTLAEGLKIVGFGSAKNWDNLSASAKAARLAKELGVKGSYYPKNIKGKEYIIIRGYAGLRKTLQGTRYLADNAKILKFGIGRAGAQAALRMTPLGLILLVAADVAEVVYSESIAQDDKWAALTAKLAYDIPGFVIAAALGVKVGGAVATTSFVAGGAAALAFAAPIVAGVAVAVVIGLALMAADKQWDITGKLTRWIIEIQRSAEQFKRDQFSRMLATPPMYNFPTGPKY